MEKGNVKSKFIGVWELVSVDSQTTEGVNLRRWNGKGRLIYTVQGYVSAQLGDPKIKNFKSENKYKATDKEMRKAFNEYDSYYGTYEIDTKNKVIKHHIELSLFPNWNGTTQERSYKFLNDHLELKVINLNRIEYTLKWKRILKKFLQKRYNYLSFFYYSFIKKYETPPCSESILNILKSDLSTYFSIYCNAS